MHHHPSSSEVNIVPTAFLALIRRAQLTNRDVELFGSHKGTIARAIDARLDAVKVEPIGSLARGTAVHGLSDLDLLLVLTRKALTWGSNLKASTTVLGEVRDALRDRYRATGIGRDGQAVVANFNDGDHSVDIVPGCYLEQGGRYNYPIYAIPDGCGGWMRTSPGSHNRYISDADARARGQLKYVAQLFKVWRQARAVLVPISGFHVELLLAYEGICEGARSYSAILRDLFVILANRGCAGLRDPVEISGVIPAANSEAKRQQALRTVTDSALHADAALRAERAGEIREALRQWNIVFNGEFPR
jgi:hypothetical protein